MKTIFKYVMAGPDCVFEIPANSEVLSVQVQKVAAGWKPVIWMLVVKEETEMETRRFVAYPTGAEIPDEAEHFLGTVQVPNALDEIVVAHVFEMCE